MDGYEDQTMEIVNAVVSTHGDATTAGYDDRGEKKDKPAHLPSICLSKSSVGSLLSLV